MRLLALTEKKEVQRILWLIFNFNLVQLGSPVRRKGNSLEYSDRMRIFCYLNRRRLSPAAFEYVATVSCEEMVIAISNRHEK